MTTVKQESQKVHPFTMHVLDKTGDTRYPNADLKVLTTDEVREKFNEIVGGSKYLAYTVPTDGSTGEVIKTFKEDVSIVLTPQMQGG